MKQESRTYARTKFDRYYSYYCTITSICGMCPTRRKLDIKWNKKIKNCRHGPKLLKFYSPISCLYSAEGNQTQDVSVHCCTRASIGCRFSDMMQHYIYIEYTYTVYRCQVCPNWPYRTLTVKHSSQIHFQHFLPLSCAVRSRHLFRASKAKQSKAKRFLFWQNRSSIRPSTWLD